MSATLQLSVVIPVYNEESNLPTLFARLYPVLDGLGRSYEILFTNDGSHDRSFPLLQAQHALRPDVTRVIDFNANYGQHMAVMAAFEHVRGSVVITLDADLQNPPEEIPKLLALTDAGFDCVGGRRLNRQDSFFRTRASRLINAVRRHTTSIEMTDQGCMLRAYSRPVVDAIVRSGATNTFIPALAYTLASRPTEVDVRHEERHAGVSNYSFYKLLRLNFDLITSFSIAPLEYFTMFAIGSSGLSLGLVVVVLFRRFVLNLDRETFGVFTFLAIILFVLSVAMIGIGLIGEYVGRTYQVVRSRQRYFVREILETKE
jgi:undecaprenyl-phosphate 4-deoxy-4-formamido-L-arabinose transferase